MTSEASGEAQAEHDSGLLTLTASLNRRHERLHTFLKVRSAVALLLMLMGTCGGVVAGAFLAAGLGWLDDPRLTRWTSGFDAVLAVFMPAAFAVLTGRTGWVWWSGRHQDALGPHQPGCGQV